METVAKTKNIVRSTEVVGEKVINTQKENLGKIYEIVIDKTSGKVMYCVLETGTFLGMGGKFLTLPWNAIRYDAHEGAFTANMTKQQLENAPGFDKDNWPEFSDEEYGKSISSYYTNL